MNKDTALRLALEALKRVLPHAKESMTNPELDIDILDAHAAITAIEARLSPQNELEAHWNEVRASYGARQAALEAKDEPVPVAIVEVFGKDWRLDYMALPVGKHKLYAQQYTYTTPPQRKPLTDEQIGDEFVRFQVGGMFTPFLYAVRAIEAAHGIKGEAK